MDYLNHLHTDDFSNPVRFRITGSEEVIFPNRTIEQVLESVLSEDSFDVALTVDSSRAEYAFDAAEGSVKEVLTEVQQVLDDFNDPPDDLSNWGEIETEEEWCERFTVELSDVTVTGPITEITASGYFEDWLGTQEESLSITVENSPDRYPNAE